MRGHQFICQNFFFSFIEYKYPEIYEALHLFRNYYLVWSFVPWPVSKKEKKFFGANCASFLIFLITQQEPERRGQGPVKDVLISIPGDPQFKKKYQISSNQSDLLTWI